MGLQIQIFNTSTTREINEAFATLAQNRADALFVSADPFFTIRRVQLANLAARYAIPSSFSVRDIAQAGGLMVWDQHIRCLSRDRRLYQSRAQRC
jgi:putative ABC transport system substrate-binding protein